MRRLFKVYPVEFLRCRIRGHLWDDVTHLDLWPETVEYLLGFKETCRCESCSGLRKRIWSTTTGRPMAYAYKMPEGYKLVDYELTDDFTLGQALKVEWSARDRAGSVKQQYDEAIKKRAQRGKKRSAA